MSQAAPARPVERVRNFYNRVGLPPVSEWMRQFTTRAQQAKDAGDPTLANMVKKQCETMLGFTTFRFPRYRPSDVHRAVCAQLERVEAREIDRLMLLMPPRHGKSELASKSYPAWSIGRKPWKQFISGSASMPLAQDWGREVRNIVNSEAYQLVYETRLSPDSQAAGKWNTQQGGSYYSVGVEGGVMGRGAHDIMLDDLYANMEEAASPVIREKVWKWYSGTIYNRLEPGGAIVLINHRMHEDDLSGRLIEKMKSGDSDADQWTIVRLPAIADEPHDLLGREMGERNFLTGSTAFMDMPRYWRGYVRDQRQRGRGSWRRPLHGIAAFVLGQPCLDLRVVLELLCGRDDAVEGVVGQATPLAVGRGCEPSDDIDISDRDGQPRRRPRPWRPAPRLVRHLPLLPRPFRSRALPRDVAKLAVRAPPQVRLLETRRVRRSRV